VWGPDSLEFRPTRWLKSDGYSAEMITPPRGSFIPWGVGPRLCPGIKTSQVEFTTVMTTLMRKCQVSAAPRAGQTMEQARKHLYKTAMDSSQSLALQLHKPGDVYLKWERR
jgi:cytochrome P450